MPPNLPPRNRPNPTNGQINPNRHDPNNPHRPAIRNTLVPKNDRENDTPKVPRRARAAADDAIGVRVHVRHEAEEGAVAGFEEERHGGDEGHHGGEGVGVGEADGEEEDTRGEAEAVDEELLAPDARAAVDEVGEGAAGGAEEDVEEAEYGGSAPRAGLAEGFEVFGVVGAQDGVDGELGAEGAEVAAARHQGLEGENDGDGFFEGQLHHDFAAGRVQHGLFGQLGFVVAEVIDLAGGGEADFGVDVEFLVRWRRVRARVGGTVAVGVGDGAGHVNHVARDAMARQVLLCGQMAFGPFAGGGVGIHDQHGDGRRGNDDKGHDKGHSPRHVGGEALVDDEGVEDGRHEEVRDASAGIAKPGGKGIGGTDNVLVKEAGGPDLARHKGTAKNADEETKRQQAIGAGDGPGERRRNGT